MELDKQLFKPLRQELFPADCEVIFVADVFADEYGGGAELTLQALIDSSPRKVFKLKASQLTLEHIRAGSAKYWVFGNYATLDPRLLPQATLTLRYSIVECDYKFCRYRSLDKHLAETGVACDCYRGQLGGMISGFMSAADHLWFMSAAQRAAYLEKFPFLADYPQTVLSSVFDQAFFDGLEELRKLPKDGRWIVQRSSSWVKGTELSEKRAKELGLDYEFVGGLPYRDTLEKLARAKGLVMHPAGADTCPRLVIEAKLLGCELDLGENVQHKDEPWFADDDLGEIEAYLKAAPSVFWSATERDMRNEKTLSGYTTTYNAVRQEYPLERCVRSMLGFCDEVVVVDGGSDDGTLDLLRVMQRANPLHADDDISESPEAELNVVSRVRVYSEPRDWSDPGSGLFDGEQKASARRKCEGDFCWQQDADEVVREEDFTKVKDLVKNFPKSVPMLALPIVEPWGSFDKIRIDTNPWKWRLSRNSPRITHGVPARARSTGSGGRLTSSNSDGCDPIDANTGEPIVFLGFLTDEMEQTRRQALAGDRAALTKYQAWFERVVANVPAVVHLSWIDIERKIRLYATNRGNFGWTAHWLKLQGKAYEDTAENNMFFDKPWSEVTDEDIRSKAKELAENTGGHIFHTKYRGQKTPWMTLGAAKV